MNACDVVTKVPTGIIKPFNHQVALMTRAEPFDLDSSFPGELPRVPQQAVPLHCLNNGLATPQPNTRSQ